MCLIYAGMRQQAYRQIVKCKQAGTRQARKSKEERKKRKSKERESNGKTKTSVEQLGKAGKNKEKQRTARKNKSNKKMRKSKEQAAWKSRET